MSIENLPEIDKYIKRLNSYLQQHYPANKKITSEEWNALFLALMHQGNLQEETLERICNGYLPLQVDKINALVNASNVHEGRIDALRTDVDFTLANYNNTIKVANQAEANSLIALEVARAAELTSQDANNTSINALEVASSANETSATALDTAEFAKAQAELAVITSNSAVETSNGATVLATAADANATTALNNSNSAIDTANTALEIANNADNTSTEALGIAQDVSNTAAEARRIAQSALDQITEGIGTQILVNGESVAVFDADTKADLDYVDRQVAAIIGAAPETLDTLEEVAAAFEENETVVDALNAAIGTKANKADIEPTIQFAEVERQKSKNLFNINKIAFKNYDRLYINKKEGILTFDNLGNASTSKILLKDFTDLKVGKTYVLSFETTSSRKFIYLNGSGVSWYSGATHTITQAELDAGIHMYGGDEGINTIKNIQIEEGTIVTDYQPYWGAVTRNGDTPIVFAESERQKSANIFDYRVQPNITHVTNNQDGSFTIANMSFYYPGWNMAVNLKPNTTYTFSETIVSVSDSDGLEANGVALDVVVYYTDNTYSSGTQYVYGPGRVAVTVSIFNKPIKNVEFRALRKNNNTSTLNGVIKDICVQEGIDTNYYPLTGPIIHEEELKEHLKDYISTSTPVALTTDKAVVFAEEERQKTKNLFDKTAVLRDHELNGNSGANASNKNYYISDYIYIKGISNLYLSTTGKTSGISNCFYDANHNYISTFSQLEGSIPVPSNAVYMRFNGLLSELNNNVQLEEGTSASVYKSYNGDTTHDITVNSFKRLPNTYQEVEYIESTGTQYINTGVIGKTGVGAEVSLMFTEVPSDGAVLGARKDDNHICPFHIYPSKWWYGYGTSNSNAKLAASANTPYYAYSVLKNGEQTLRVNDTPVALSGTSTTDINTNVNMYIFAMNKNNSEVIYPSKFKLYMMRIYEVNTMVRDYIPCYRKSDGVAGLYDAVNNKFYTNAGTGSFLIGPSNMSKVLSNENPECFNSGLKIIKTGSVLDRTGSKDASIYCERRDTGVACHFGVGSGGTNHGFFSLPLNRWILYANKTSSYLKVNEIDLTV